MVGARSETRGAILHGRGIGGRGIRGLVLVAVALTLTACFSEPLGDQYRISGFKWAVTVHAKNVSIRTTTQVSTRQAQRQCPGLPSTGLPPTLGVLTLVGNFAHGQTTAFLIVTPTHEVIAEVPIPQKPCI